jgi:hypothetical protein
MSIDKSDYPIHVHVVWNALMKHELLIHVDFLDIVQIAINAGEVVINTSKSVSEDKEVREMY